MSKTCYLIDGHAQIYRAFYAPFRDLNAPNGEPTRATYVFCQMLLNLLKNRRPDYLAMVMDVSDETVFRRDLDPEYKAHRDPPPEALDVQANRIVQIINALGIPLLRIPTFEADDLLATIATQHASADLDIYLVSRDKDLEQLIGPHVHLYDATKDEVIDAARLEETKGYKPEQAVDIQTLTGDATDNVKGVPGIGPKTALKLINKFGNAQAVVENADQLTPKQRENVEAFASRLDLTRQLVTLRRDVPLEFDLEACRTDDLKIADALPIFIGLNFNRLTDAFVEFGNLDDDARETARGQAAAAVAAIAAPSTGGSPAGTTSSEAAGNGSSDATTQPAPAGQASDQSADATGATLPSAEELAKLTAAWSVAPHEPGTYTLVNTAAALEQLAKDLKQQTAFAFDTETTGRNPVAAELVGLSFSWEAGRGYYVPVRSTLGKALPQSEVLAALGPILEDNRIGKVGQNLKYDIIVLRQVGIRVAGITFDTMLAHFLLDPLARSHGMDAMAQELLDYQTIPISTLIGKGKQQITIDQAPLEDVCTYAAEDADITWRLKEVLAPRLEASPFLTLFTETELPLVDVLAEMEHNGIALNVSRLHSLSNEMGDRLLDLIGKIHRAAGEEFNVDSPKQLAAILFDKLGLPVGRKTKTGRSTDADTLETLVRQTEHDLPRLVLEYRALAKLKNTYLDTLPLMMCAKTGRIHASFHQTVAVTGRLSSSDPNLQNIPIRTEAGRQIRTAFVAQAADHVLLAADYSQIELRVLAHFSQDEALLTAFREGQDIHRSVAAEVNGISMEEVTSEQRSAAKAVNFGLIYGQTAFGLAQALDIPVSEAKQFIDTYFERYPSIRRFNEECIAKARRLGYAETMLGRRRPIPELNSRNQQQVGFGRRIAVNTVIQGTAADLVKRAMIDIHHAIQAGTIPARLLIQVHDELVFEIARDDVDRVSEEVRTRMAGAIPLDVPIVVDIASGPSWAESK
jgi:DNA polymerase-1